MSDNPHGGFRAHAVSVGVLLGGVGVLLLGIGHLVHHDRGVGKYEIARVGMVGPGMMGDRGPHRLGGEFGRSDSRGGYGFGHDRGGWGGDRFGRSQRYDELVEKRAVAAAEAKIAAKEKKARAAAKAKAAAKARAAAKKKSAARQ